MSDQSLILSVVILGNPGALGINNAKKAVVVGKTARLVDVGSSRKAKVVAAATVWKAVLEQTDAAIAVAEAGTLVVEIDAYWPRRRKLARADELALGDVDAPLKLTIDALESCGAIDDDARVVELRARKFIDRDNPRIELRVMPAPHGVE